MIGVILNPHALGVARDRSLDRRLRAVLASDGEVFETRTPEELERAVEALARQGCDLVASCGGDGTQLSTLTELVRRFGSTGLPRYAILRGGTVNTVAANLGICGPPDVILQGILARRRRREPPIEIGQDLLEVNGRHGFLFAAAMGARFLDSYYAGPRQGIAWASWLAARTVISSLCDGGFSRHLFQPVAVRLVADGEALAIDGVRLLCASVVPSVGIGMKVTWQGGHQPNRFHLVASGLSTFEMARQLHRVLAGRPLVGEPHVDRLLQRLDVEFTAREPYTIDGELFAERQLTIRVGPRIWIVKP